jgi:hypothetical protein
MTRSKEPRKARALSDTNEAWWYVDPRSIIVHGEVLGLAGERWVTSVRLTRKQLERALEIMDSA